MITSPTEVVTPKGLPARVFGVLFSPRATYADIVVRPRPLPALVLCVVIVAAINYAFLTTDIGQRALLDQQLTTMESFGVKVTDQILTTIRQTLPRAALFSVVGIAVFVPLVAVVTAGVFSVIFNAILGGDAGFAQIFAIVAYSGVIGVLEQLFVTPLNYVRESMSSATSLAVFLPMIDSGSFLGMLAGSINFFRIWSLVSMAIGLSVLYKRRTAPIAWGLLAAGFVIVLIVAGVRAAISGA